MSRITQKGASGPLALTANGTFQQSTDSSLKTLVGSRWDLEDGREVRLVLAGASSLVSGTLISASAPISDHQNLTVTAVQAYSNNGNTPAQVTVTLGATAVTANQYAGGYMIVNDNTGQGQTLQIASHPAAALSTNVVITLADGPNTALDTTSQVTLIANPCNGVIITNHSALQQPVGVALYPITNAEYGFITSKGVTSCLNDGGWTAGSAVSASNATDGAVENGVIAQGFVGFALEAGTSTEYNTICINL